MAELHQAIGGTQAWRRLAVAFYSRVDRDPLLRPLFTGKTLRCAIEEFTAFLVQVFEGPSEAAQRRWWLSLHESHRRFKIRSEERTAWMQNMVAALDDARIEEPFRSALLEFFERSSAYIVNAGEPVSVIEDGKPRDEIRCGIDRRWEAQRGVDDAVAAVRGGDAERAIANAERIRDCSVLAGLLAQMMREGSPEMLRYVQERVTLDPTLVRERYAGRTLLHEASAQGNATVVQLLLRLGADPNAQDGGGHAPLYCLANECRASEAGEVVRALGRGGANVNASDGVKHCTALHMAARRGNVEVAAALLDCGAEVDARDSVGDTPLRRSVNCNKIPVASLLVAWGADLDSVGSKGLTPMHAARTSAMRDLLRS